MESQWGSETPFCKSFHVIVTSSPSFIWTFTSSVGERRNNRLQSETLRLKNPLNKMNANVFCDYRAERASGAPSSAASWGGWVRKPSTRPRASRGGRETAQSGDNAEIRKTWSWINEWTDVESGKMEGTRVVLWTLPAKEPWRLREGLGPKGLAGWGWSPWGFQRTACFRACFVTLFSNAQSTLRKHLWLRTLWISVWWGNTVWALSSVLSTY